MDKTPAQRDASKHRSQSRKGKGRGSPYVPYARGFTPPTPKERQLAIGSTAQRSRPYFSVSENFFASVPKPSSIDDWLAQYNEEGQTYQEFRRGCPWLCNRKGKYIRQTFVPSGKNLREKYPDGKIYIMPLGNFDEESSICIDDLLDYSQRFFGLTVIALNPPKLEQKNGEVFWIDEPKSESTGNTVVNSQRKSGRVKRHRLTTRYHSATGKIQLCVDSNLTRLRSEMPDDAICMMGLTMFDLYADEPDLFVAGMAAGGRRVGVFSFYRYDPALSISPEFWYETFCDVTVCTHDRKRLLLQRSCRLLVHEICHLLGVGHCIYFACCMNGSGHLEEDFKQPMFLCPVDLHKLQTVCGFEILDRYQKLLEFYKKHNLTGEVDWTSKRIKFIKDENDAVKHSDTNCL